jgi:hypothetical protein
MEIGTYHQGMRYAQRGGHLACVEAGDGAADDQALDLAGALEEGKFVGRAWSQAVRMSTIMCLTWQEAGDRR